LRKKKLREREIGTVEIQGAERISKIKRPYTFVMKK